MITLSWRSRLERRVREDIMVAEPAFIAFRVDAGVHDVRLVYTYLNWRHILGLVVSLLGLGLIWLKDRFLWK
jgi:hypothetical protein